ncbi:molybdate transport system ATP-binding protein [Catalinimonas alkaloidigena]|uniref:ATP-binding cassette domain-containing protein n=1 Tax=Catalinimonas alkaloidigena TaxID=1075417 RepID=UPI002405E34A|nr:ATP-binding cassette domain-containing protein [Catalinimonas alkaloidigena]MDF9796599.1 molybdate transport system ATP-binding protein [Catalinimonas alkaloidigena]
MITVRNVSLVKHGKKIFEKLNWKIEAGEHWVICGNNGSGKTLLLELLAGKAQLSEGKVAYDFIHEDGWHSYFDALRNKIRYIPAHAAHTLLKKYDGLFYQQRYYGSFNEGIPLVKDVFEEKLELIDLLDLPASFSITNLLELPLTRLSNGQFKKVLIILYLLQGDAQLLLLDYPFEGLDHESRKHLCRFIDHIAHAQGLQVILTDHYHALPEVINRRLVVRDNMLDQQEMISPSKEGVIVPQKNEQRPSGGNASVVEMKNLRIQYGDKVVLKNFNWRVNQGDRWVLAGKNGSGKTTLFSLIYADHPLAYSQEVYLFGKRRGSGESIWDIKKRINYLGPELISFMNHRGIRSSALEYLTQHFKTYNENRLTNLITYFEANSFIQKPVHQLSSGQLQLMLLIQCFLDEKELILLDEPFQFLDPTQKMLVRRYMQDYLNESKTLIMVTHYQQDIAEWAENIMYI